MATVESTEIGIHADGRSGYYKVVFTDTSDQTVMENGTGFTLTGSVTGTLTAAVVGIPRVDIRNTKVVVSGIWKLASGVFPWYGLTHETITADGAAGGLFGARVGATESAAFTALSVMANQRSRVDASGNLLQNLRRTRFKAGAVATAYSYTPVLEFNADLETHTDGATVAITDQISAGTAAFNKSSTGTNAFTWRQDYYGTGRNCIELDTNNAIRNTNAINQDNGYTMHFVCEVDYKATDSDARWAEALDGAGGFNFHASNGSWYVRSPDGPALVAGDNDGDRYQPVDKMLVVYTVVVNINGDRRMWVDGRSYEGDNLAPPSGSFTNKNLIFRRNVDTGKIRIRYLAIVGQELTASEVRHDRDYIANTLFAGDEDLGGLFAVFVSSTDGAAANTGMFNSPKDAFTTASMGSGSIGTHRTGKRQMSFLCKAGDIIPTEIDGLDIDCETADPLFPTNVGVYGTISPSAKIPVIDFVDPQLGTNSDVCRVRVEMAFTRVEFTSRNRNYRADGTATTANNEQVRVTLFRAVASSVGLQILGCPISQFSHAVVDAAGALSGQNWSHRHLHVWQSPVRNTYLRTSTQGTSGTQEASSFFPANREQIWMPDLIGYENGYDPDVVLSSASLNLWNTATSNFTGAATDRPALDNGYTRWGYLSSMYGAVWIENLVTIRQATNIQMRQGGQMSNHVTWEGAGKLFWAGGESSGSRILVEGTRQVIGGNIIGYRGSPVGVIGSGDSPRQMKLSEVLIHSPGVGDNATGINIHPNRSTAPSHAPSGACEYDFRNITVQGFNSAVIIRAGGTVSGTFDRLIFDLDGSATSSFVIDCPNTSDLSAWPMVGFGYDRGTKAAATAFQHDGTPGTLAALATATGQTISPTLDRTTEGWGYSKRTLAQWCTTVHGFTKVDSGQTDAEELGEQWYEAFADAIREGGDPSPYYATAALDWVLAGWAPDSASQAAIEAVDSGNYWGAFDYLDAPPPTAPSVADLTLVPTAITATSATLGGTVDSDGGDTITQRGVVVSLTSDDANPTVGAPNVTEFPTSGTTGLFTVSATGLVASSGYSYRVYATNSVGTGYSDAGTFTTAPAPPIPSVIGRGRDRMRRR